MRKLLLTAALILGASTATAETDFTGGLTDDSGPMVDNARTYGLVLKTMSAEGYAVVMGDIYAKMELCHKYIEPTGDLIGFMAAVSAYPNEFLEAAGTDEATKFVTTYIGEYARFDEITAGLDDATKEATYKAGCALIADKYRGIFVGKE